MSDRSNLETRFLRWWVKLGAEFVVRLLFGLSVVLLWLIAIFYYFSRGPHYIFIWFARCVSAPWVLFVYSDSPSWREHIETSILPKLPKNSDVICLSRRTTLAWSFPVLVWHHFVGRNEVYPMGLVFRFGRPVKRFRFFHAYHDTEHGIRTTFGQTQEAFFAELGVHAL